MSHSESQGPLAVHSSGMEGTACLILRVKTTTERIGNSLILHPRLTQRSALSHDEARPFTNCN